MRKILLAAALLLIPIYAFGQQSVTPYVVNGGGTTAPITYCQVGTVATGTCPMPVTGTFTPGGTQDVNLIQTGGVTQLRGSGATGTGSERVTVAIDSATVAGSASIPAGTNVIGHVITDTGSTTAVTGNVTVVQPTASNLNAAVVGTGTAGSAATGVVTIQGIASGTVVPISGTVTDTNPIGITPTDGTITSATGSSQTVFALNASRHGLIIQNTGNANCGVNPTGGTAVIGGAATLTLFPGGSYQPRIPTLSAVTAICTSGQPLYAEQN